MATLCKICNMKFRNNNTLLSHINVHIGRKCKDCNQTLKISVSKENESLQCHQSHIWLSEKALLSKQNTSPLPPLPSSTLNTSNRANQSHYINRTTSVSNITLQCKHCSYSTHCNSRFAKHMRVHTNERPFKCSRCDKAFTVKCNLVQHIRSVHVKEKRFKCNVCGSGFIRSDRLKEHQRIHTGEKPLKCKHCSERFATSSRLYKHIKKHTGYQCKFCNDVTFPTEYQLKAHKTEKHSNIIKNKSKNYLIGTRWFPFGCDYCGLRFLTNELLSKHLEKHNGLICNKCNKLFQTKDITQKHQAECKGIVVSKPVQKQVNRLTKPVSSDGKNHYCAECDRYFPSGCSLGGHVSRVHSYKKNKNKNNKRKSGKKRIKKRVATKRVTKSISMKDTTKNMDINAVDVVPVQAKTKQNQIKDDDNIEIIDATKWDLPDPEPLPVLAAQQEPDYMRYLDVNNNNNIKDIKVFNETEIKRDTKRNIYIPDLRELDLYDSNNDNNNNNNNSKKDVDVDDDNYNGKDSDDYNESDNDTYNDIDIDNDIEMLNTFNTTINTDNVKVSRKKDDYRTDMFDGFEDPVTVMNNDKDDDIDSDINNNISCKYPVYTKTKIMVKKKECMKKPVEKEIQKPLKDCPGRHGLIQGMTPDNRVFECDECNRTMYLNEEKYGCRWCNFDLCVPCFIGKTDKNVENIDLNSYNELAEFDEFDNDNQDFMECKTMRFDYTANENENSTKENHNVNIQNKQKYVQNMDDNQDRKRKRDMNCVRSNDKQLNNVKKVLAPPRKKRKLTIKIRRRIKKTKKKF